MKNKYCPNCNREKETSLVEKGNKHVSGLCITCLFDGYVMCEKCNLISKEKLNCCNN